MCPRDNMWQLWRVRWRVWHSQCVCHTLIHLASSLQDSSHNYPVTGPCHTPDTPSLSSQWSPPPTPLVRAPQSCGWYTSDDTTHLCDSAASPDSKLKSQLCYPLMYFLSPTWMWEELRSCPARLGEPATQLMFSLIWVGWLTPPGRVESMFLSHQMSGKIKKSKPGTTLLATIHTPPQLTTKITHFEFWESTHGFQACSVYWDLGFPSREAFLVCCRDLSHVVFNKNKPCDEVLGAAQFTERAMHQCQKLS